MRIAKIGYITLSAVFLAFGTIMIILPESAVDIFGRFCGIAMIVFGAIKFEGYLSKDLYRLAFQYDLQFGILLIVLGLIITFRPVDRRGFLTIALGVLILSDGLFKIKIAFDAKKFGIKIWWILFALSLTASAIGLALLFRPNEIANLPIILLGSSLIADGAMNLFVAISMVKIVKNQLPDDVDEHSNDQSDGII